MILEYAQEHPYPEIWAADAIHWAKDLGVLVRRGKQWWASNDIRWGYVGVRPNDQLTQPTLGPFTSRHAAGDAYDKARAAAHARCVRELAFKKLDRSRPA